MASKPAFEYRHIDVEGEDTLKNIAAASRLNEWMYQNTSKNLSGRILEIGSGIGNISAFYLRDGRELMMSDIREHYCNQLREAFSDQPSLQGVREIDLVDPTFETRYADLLETFDGAFALNVVEHIEDDELALANAYKLLKPGGRLVILVPAYQALYNRFDEVLEHYRRYTKKSLQAIFRKNGYQIDRSEYYNLAGIPGWFVFGKLLKREIIEEGPLKLYNALVPLFKFADRVTGKTMGLSVIVEGTKPG